MKIKSSLIAIIILSLFISCNNNDINEVEKKINTSVQQMPENMINLSDRLMFVAQTQAMNDVYEAVMKSMEYGLDETTIKLNNVDDEIMDETIARTAMFTTETQVDNTTYKKSFSKAGVTIGTTCRKIEGA